jgi:hypothetical protein
LANNGRDARGKEIRNPKQIRMSEKIMIETVGKEVAKTPRFVNVGAHSTFRSFGFPILDLIRISDFGFNTHNTPVVPFVRPESSV